MNSLSLRYKLALSYAAVIIIVAVVFAGSIITLHNIGSRFSALSEVNLPIIEAIKDVRFSGTRVISSTNEYLLNAVLDLDEADEELEQIEESREEYTHAIDSFSTLLSANMADQDDEESLTAVKAAGQKVFDIVDEILRLQASDASIEELTEQREEFEPAEAEFLAAVDSALARESEELIASQNAVEAIIALADTLAIILAVIAIALVILGMAYINRTILRPLSDLSKVALSLKDGNLTVRSDIQSNDEIGQFANAFNAMSEQIAMQLAILEDQLMETEEARAQAVRSDQVKSAFLASMSHELRTPLNAVINFTRFVIDGDTGPVNDEQTELLTQVVASAKHLLNLINDVLDMSKIEAGALNLFIEDDVSLNTLVTSAMKTGQSLLAGKPVEMQSDIEEDLPLIVGDRQRIMQILLNIVSNACKFTEEGAINIRAYKDDDEIIVSVADTGPGITPDNQAMVFEAFKQTESGLRQGGGTGLGMPIARSLAEAHGGRLWLESETGKGSTFFVALPLKSDSLVPVMA